MKTVLILRHAKSSWKQPDLADHERPLNKRGHRDAPRVGRLLRAQDLVPDSIVSSTAKRAEATAVKAAEAAGYQGDVQCTPRLYHADVATLLDVLRGLDQDCNRVLLVGHNPGLEEFLETLTGLRLALPTAALAQVNLRVDSWQEMHADGKGTLVHIWRPRQLPDETA